MIEGGYVLQPRCFDRSDASHFPPVTRELWFYLLRNANFSNRDSTDRGEVLITLNQVMDALCWHVGYRKETYSKPQLTKSLRRLREGNMIATRKTTRGIVVTICNYDHYQTPGNYVGNDEGMAKETPRKEKGHTIHKKEKERKEGKEGKEASPKGEELEGEFYLSKNKRKLSGKRLETFERFWHDFSYKKGKSEAADAWINIDTLTDSLVETICDAARREANARDGIIKENRTPKMAQGWITGRRWEDEPEASRSGKAGKIEGVTYDY